MPLSSSPLALDLSAAGAPAQWQRAHDPETEQFVMGRLAGLAHVADGAGIDLIALDPTFRLGGRLRRDAWLDGALAASRLGRHTASTTLAAPIPLGVTDPSHVASAVASVHRATSARGAWQVSTAGQANGAHAVDEVLAALAAPRTNRRTGAAATSTPAVVVSVATDVDIELAAARADVARLRVATLEEARLTRAAIRQAAQDWGRAPDQVRVLVDVHAVIGADHARAQARAELLAELDEAHPEGLLHTVGTAADLATLWQNWVRAGAADGFTVLPASIPADVVAVARDLVPELRARGLRPSIEPATASQPGGTPAPVRAAARAQAPAPARPSRRVRVSA